MEKKTTIYRCATRMEATDRANLYYIAAPAARRMETDNAAKVVRVFGRKAAPLAEFHF